MITVKEFADKYIEDYITAVIVRIYDNNQNMKEYSLDEAKNMKVRENKMILTINYDDTAIIDCEI